MNNISVRIFIILGITLGLVWQSVVGEWGLSFILLQWVSRRFSDSLVLLAGFGLGLFTDLIASHTLGSSSIMFLAFITLYWLLLKRYENQHFLLSILTAICAVVLIQVQRIVEYKHFNLVTLWQVGVIVMVVSAFSLIKQFTQPQEGIFLRK